MSTGLLLSVVFISVAIILIKLPTFIIKPIKAGYSYVANIVASSLGLGYSAVLLGLSLLPEFNLIGFILGAVFFVASAVMVFVSYLGFPKDEEVFNK